MCKHSPLLMSGLGGELGISQSFPRGMSTFQGSKRFPHPSSSRVFLEYLGSQRPCDGAEGGGRALGPWHGSGTQWGLDNMGERSPLSQRGWSGGLGWGGDTDQKNRYIVLNAVRTQKSEK